jgi:hypothetical protein
LPARAAERRQRTTERDLEHRPRSDL